MSEETLPPIDNTSLIDDKIPEANQEGQLKDFSFHFGGEKGADYTLGNIGAEYSVAGKHYYDANATSNTQAASYNSCRVINMAKFTM